MKTTKTKKPNMLWLQNNKKMFRTFLVTISLLLGINYDVMAQGWNTSYGINAGVSISKGDHNAAFGYQALRNTTYGSENVATGSQTLFANTTGKQNVANGSQALFTNTTGSYNTVSGAYALYNSTTASWNTANGHGSLNANTTGQYNTAIGFSTLVVNKTGDYNTALGYKADVALENLSNATAIGANAKVTASNTIQLGDNTVTKVYAGVGNTATLITGGLQVTAGMPAAGKVLTSDADGVATWQTPMGGGSGWSLVGTAGTVDGTNFIGTTDNIPFNIRVNNQKAGRIDANNAFYGYQSGNARTTGGFNTAHGYQALYANTAGDGNTAIGDRSLLANTTGNYNTAIGSLTLSSNIDGKYNTAIGYNADVNTGLTNATAIGSGAKATVSNTIQLGDAAVTKVFAGVGNTATLVAGGLQVTSGMPAIGKVLTSDANGVATWQNPMGGGAGWSLTGNTGTNAATNFVGTTDDVDIVFKRGNIKAGVLGSTNTLFGLSALLDNTTGTNNTAVGVSALLYNTTGRNNTALGYNALSNNETGRNNTAVGYMAGPNADPYTNTTAIGYNSSTTADNQIRIGNSAVTSIGGQVGWTTLSDSRVKKDIQATVPGLAFITKLRPVTYHLNMDAITRFLKTPDSLRLKDAEAIKGMELQTGFLAQEVEKAAQELNFEFSGVDKPKNQNDLYGLRYAEFTVPLVKAVQELEQKNQAQEKTIQQLQQRLETLEKLLTSNTKIENNIATKQLETAGSEDITLYPNPTTGICTITASNINNGVIEIYDMAGNNMQKTTFNNVKAGYQLNVSGYAKGVYLLNIIANNKKYTKRLVIQ